MSGNKKILQLPSMDLATGDLKESSPEWMREFVKEHGSTNPLKIERRRKKLSAYVDVLERAIPKANTFKKLALAELSKVINHVDAALKEEKDQAQREVLAQQLGGLKWQKLAQDYELSEQVRRTIVDYSIVEGLCLVIDSLTIRATVQAKSGKKGFRRYSMAGMISDVGVDTEYITGLFRMFGRKIYPDGVIPPEMNPESDAFRKDDDGDIDDEDVLSDAEGEEIEKTAKIEDEE